MPDSIVDLPITPKYGQQLEEALSFFSQFNGLGNIFGQLFNSDGNLWNVTGGAGAPGAFWSLFWQISSTWFNRMQRYACRFAFLSNGIASDAINYNTLLVMASGFKYSSQNKSLDKRLQTFLKRNKFVARSVEGYRRWLTDGEVFYRIKGEGAECKVRFVDPDLIYSDSDGGQKNDYFGGLLYNEWDNEEPTSFKVWQGPVGNSGEPINVPAAQMQHRSNTHWGQKRGLSWLLPVLSDALQADSLMGNLMGSAELLAKIAVIRQHQAPPGAVELMRSQIQAQSQAWVPVGQNGTPPTPCYQPVEAYPPGAIIDSSASTEYKALGSTQDYQQFTNVLDASLRKIASHFFVPSGIFGQDKSGDRGAFASELVHGSWIVRALTATQDRWKEQDLELLEKCGFPADEIDIESTDAAVIDKKAMVDETTMLLKEKIVSRETICTESGRDWTQESARIKKEAVELPEDPGQADPGVERPAKEPEAGEG